MKCALFDIISVMTQRQIIELANNSIRDRPNYFQSFSNMNYKIASDFSNIAEMAGVMLISECDALGLPAKACTAELPSLIDEVLIQIVLTKPLWRVVGSPVEIENYWLEWDQMDIHGQRSYAQEILGRTARRAERFIAVAADKLPFTTSIPAKLFEGADRRSISVVDAHVIAKDISNFLSDGALFRVRIG